MNMLETVLTIIISRTAINEAINIKCNNVSDWMEFTSIKQTEIYIMLEPLYTERIQMY